MIIAVVLTLLSVTGPLEGTVRDPTGRPLAGATVVVRQGAVVGSATTDDSGAFAVADIALPAVVEVSAAGFAPLRRLVDRSPAEFVLAPASIRESVIVQAATAATAWRDGATGRTILAADDLERIPAITLDDALHVVSGFSLFRRSSSRASNPTTHGVTMRGLSASGASRGLVLLDGVPLNDGFGGWVTWTRLPPLAIDRIEIDRGAEGEAFGTDAMGGVIGVVAPAGRAARTAAGVEAGTAGIAGADIAGSRVVGRLWLFGAASGFRTDGVIPLEPVSRGPVDRRADATWANAFGRATLGWGTRRLTATGWGGRDDRGNGTVQQVNTMRGGTSSVAFDTAGAATTLSARVAVSPNRFDQTFTSVTAVAGVPRAAEVLTSTQTIDAGATRAVVEIGRALPRGRVGARAAVSRASARFTDVRPASTTSLILRDDSEAVAVHASVMPAARVAVGAGLRREWRAAPAAVDSRDATTVGRVTGSWSGPAALVVRGSAATSHRWPTLNELVRNFQVGAVLTQANPDLRPERGRSADVAVGIARRRWDASIGGYWSVVDDAIANVTITGTLRQRRNTGEAHARGVELDASARPVDGVRVRGSVTYADASFRRSLEPPLEGRRLPQVPRWSAAVSADAMLGAALELSGVWRVVSSQFDDDRNVFRLAPAYQFDVRAAWRMKAWLAWMQVENLFDGRIEVGRTPLVTLAPGRSARVGLTWRR